jgi:hypothetical protein
MTMFHNIELPEGKTDLAFRRFSVKNHVATAPAMIPGCQAQLWGESEATIASWDFC